MKFRSAVVRLVLLTCVVGSPAFAQGDAGQELIEKVVVRNRLYSVARRFELGASLGLVFMPRLTDHYNFNAVLGFNVSETLGFELRGGWAASRQTGLANQIREHAVQATATRIEQDMADLWEMKFNGAVGVRWAPIYGKISLMAELPVHFQAYLWLGGGAGTFRRESVVYCTQVVSGSCAESLVDEKTTGLFSGAVGFRFFTHQHGSIKIEVRDYSFPDSYLVDIDRDRARAGQQTGTPASAPGLTHLVMADIGYSFIF